jgi:hypothetical protein
MSLSESKTDAAESLISPGTLPPLGSRDLPPPIPLARMIGPSIILAGLALGSGEFVLWPYITLKSGFTLFWACLAAVAMQYFLNLEIMRWTLATGETAMTGIIRLSRHFAWIFLLLNILPWMIPAWAKGAGEIIGWMIHEPQFNAAGQSIPGPYETWIALAGLWLCGIILTAGPVVYETVERVQFFLVVFIIAIVIGLAAWLVWGRPDAVLTQITTTATLGAPQFIPPLDGDLTPMALLGALAFAGAGGTMNLCQSNYIRDKGYAMGNHIGRITSPLTGQQEAIHEIGSHFPHNELNLGRWRAWFRAAAWEHFFSFLMTCFVCLTLLTLICYICFFDAQGNRALDPHDYKEMRFIWAQSNHLAAVIGPAARWLFLVMGVAILFTTEFGVLDAASRISTDIVKVTWLRDNPRWTGARLYFTFLWGEIALASLVLLLELWKIQISALGLFKLTAAMNGGVMFLYSMCLVYMNCFRLPSPIRIAPWRLAILLVTVVFFGCFTVWAGYDTAVRLFAPAL